MVVLKKGGRGGGRIRGCFREGHARKREREERRGEREERREEEKRQTTTKNGKNFSFLPFFSLFLSFSAAPSFSLSLLSLRRALEVRDQVRAVLGLLEPGEDHLGACFFFFEERGRRG